MSMNHRPRALRPGPECAKFAPLLALVGQEDVDTLDTSELRQHLATCAYCQRELQGYHALDAALSRQFGVPARPPLARADIAYIMREDYRSATGTDDVQEAPAARLDAQPRRSTPIPPPTLSKAPRPLARRTRTRRVLSLFSAVAAVLVIALVAAALFASRHNVPATGTNNTPTATNPTPTLPAYVPDANDVFSSISMVSPTEGWISGYNFSSATFQPLLLHYLNGSLFRETNLQGEDQGITIVSLAHVVMLSANEGWAIGAYGGAAGCNGAVLLHYSNGQWKANQRFSGIGINSIAFASPADGWAVGGGQACNQSSPSTPIMYHYDGKSWAAVSAPSDAVELDKVVMTSASDGWMLGLKLSSGNGANATTPGLLLHYDGKSWSEVSIPGVNQLGVVQFADLSMVSATNGWLAGTIYGGGAVTNALHAGTPSKSVLFHFDGKQWNKASTVLDSIRGASVNSLSLVPSNDGWLIGAALGTGTFFLRLSGGTWAKVNPPTGASLAQIVTLAANDAWAIGTGELPLLLHYQNGSWETISLSPAVTPTAQASNGTPTTVVCNETSGPSLPTPGKGTPATIIPFTSWAAYTSTAYHFTINYPAGWEVSGICADSVYLSFTNYDPEQVNGPGFPHGAIKLELYVRDNPSGMTAMDFWNQEMQAEQQGGGGAPCSSYSTKALTIAGRNAVRGACPSQGVVSYYIPDGQVMLNLVGFAPYTSQPPPLADQMVNSLAFSK